MGQMNVCFNTRILPLTHLTSHLNLHAFLNTNSNSSNNHTPSMAVPAKAAVPPTNTSIKLLSRDMKMQA